MPLYQQLIKRHVPFSVVLLAAALLSGCLSSVQPNPPRLWNRAPLSIRALPSGGPKLQVIVTYDATYSTHAALRLSDRVAGALFWDPAGRYGETSIGPHASNMKRVNDLIVENEPTLEMYWAASVNASDTAMEVFEWNLSLQQARRIRTTLLHGARSEEGWQGFQTKTIKPFCSSAISGFLKTAGYDPVRLEHTYLLPHGLAEALYRSDPDRVIIFRRGQKATVYTKRGSGVDRQAS